VPGFRVADGDTWWYKVASSPWNGTYYASADAFYNNGQTSGSLVGTPFVDASVPNCGAPPPPPPPPPPAPASNPGGHVDSVSRTDAGHVRLVGWTTDADSPDAQLTVQVLIDGTVAGTGNASLSRADVGAHGFYLTVPVDGNMHTVCAQALNVGGGQDVVLPRCLIVASVTPPTLTGDLNDDGVVGCADEAILTSNYGATGTGLSGDLNADGVVNVFDLSILLSHFTPGQGPCSS
jgi:hypothetical protein